MKIPILATGLSGLVGSRVKELLGDKFEFTDLSLATGIDITDAREVEKNISQSKARTILHLAAKTDVDACEEDKILLEEGQAWRVNVIGTENIVEGAQKMGMRVIYISTDFVFDGTKEAYTEDDEPNPLNWYGETKYEGEKIVQEKGVSFAIARLAYPYRAYFPAKLDFVRKIMEKGRSGGEILALTDHIFTPTFIDDIAAALEVLLEKELVGIFHLVGNQSLTVYEAVCQVAAVFDLPAKVRPVTREVYFKGRAFRPRNLALKNDKITRLGIKLRGFEEGLEEVKRQSRQ